MVKEELRGRVVVGDVKEDLRDRVPVEEGGRGEVKENWGAGLVPRGEKRAEGSLVLGGEGEGKFDKGIFMY